MSDHLIVVTRTMVGGKCVLTYDDHGNPGEPVYCKQHSKDSIRWRTDYPPLLVEFTTSPFEDHQTVFQSSDHSPTPAGIVNGASCGTYKYSVTVARGTSDECTKDPQVIIQKDGFVPPINPPFAMMAVGAVLVAIGIALLKKGFDAEKQSKSADQG